MHLRFGPGCCRARTRNWISASSSRLVTRLAWLLRLAGRGKSRAATTCSCPFLRCTDMPHGCPIALLRHLARPEAPVRPAIAAIRLTRTSMPWNRNTCQADASV